MNTAKTAERRAGGVDQRHVPESNRATDIVNMRLDSEGLGWVADRGWEPYNPTSGFTNFDADAGEPCISLHVGDGGELLFERNGNLLWQHGLASGSLGTTPANQVLDTGRHQPKPDDPGTQYVEHQGFTLIINGVDAPLKWFGGKRVTPFGFDAQPGPPTVFTPDPTYYRTAGAGAIRNASGTSALRLNQQGGAGLGIVGLTDTETNSYFYRVALVSDTGSIGPMSEPVRATWSFDIGAESGEPGRFGVVLRDLPTGGSNTQARIIYRTKNTRLLDSQGQTEYFYLATVAGNVGTDFVDVTPDAELVDPAPSITAAEPFSKGLRFAASWDGRVWASGGVGHERRLIYSDRGAPETFGAFSYIDLGNRQGGKVTGLYSYYDSLLVIRERSIESVRFASDGVGYRVSTLSPDVGTAAINSFVEVPGLGLMFLAQGGLYAASERGLKLMSSPVSKELRRVTVGALARATAAWSPREREVWFHYPADGETGCNRGLVYHPEQQAFSLRHATSTSNLGAFRFNSLATLPSGRFVIAPESSLNGDLLINPGLHVWAAGKDEGSSYIVTALVGSSGYTINSEATGPRVGSTWASSWESLGGDTQLKSVRYILVEVLTDGHEQLEAYYGRDGSGTWTSCGSQAPAVALTYGGDSEDVVFGPSGGVVDRVATLGADTYSQPRVTRLRFDIGGSSLSWFRWKIESQAKFTVLSYSVEFVNKGQRALKQR